MKQSIPSYILTLSCPDTPGIVAAIAGRLAEQQCNILDSAQFGDASTRQFFMRVTFAAPLGFSLGDGQTMLAPVFERFTMQASIHESSTRSRVLVMVSRFGHCLNDLLYRHSVGALSIEIPAIVSNHKDYYQLAASHNIPFHHLPVNAETKEKQERRLAEIVSDEAIDLVVLARYMQVLSPDFCARMPGRIINIHHSFLPSFKGAKPYHQAHARGVKLIGATAHYVTSDLDEGPIIEQDVTRANHAIGPDELVAVGRDVECQVLARAVRWHAEHRVLLNGHRTVVFR